MKGWSKIRCMVCALIYITITLELQMAEMKWYKFIFKSMIAFVRDYECKLNTSRVGLKVDVN